MSKSLQEICYENIMMQIMSLPPLMQEMITQRTIKHIEKRAEKKLRRKIEKQVSEKILHRFVEDSKILIPEMIDDMEEMRQTGRYRKKNYYNTYKNVSKNTIDSCSVISDHLYNNRYQ